jgi:hypothetical protein
MVISKYEKFGGIPFINEGGVTSSIFYMDGLEENIMSPPEKGKGGVINMASKSPFAFKRIPFTLLS